MSGFTGFIDNINIDDKKRIIKEMSDKIIHRGPDGDGYFTDNRIAMGFRQLNITDSSVNVQPLYNKSQNLILTFDGEIYNSKELREILVNKGYDFKTESDAEIVINGYEEYGENILPMLRGKFAFVIYSSGTGELFGARDSFGVKPFYYYADGDLFIYGSEIKSFLPHPNFKKEMNENILKLYLTFQYSPLEQTIFKGVNKLLPGTWFRYQDGKLEFGKYFSVEYDFGKDSFAYYKNLLKNSIEDSIDRHKTGNIRVGGFLSSGVDSSFIASVMKPSETFSAGFDNTFNESVYAKELSDILKIENHSRIITSDEFFAALPSVQYHSDEPHANLSAVPLYFLSELAAGHVKVSLSGEGPDELFAGYQTYIQSKAQKLYRLLPFAIRRYIKNRTVNKPHFKGKNLIFKEGSKVEDYYIGQAFIMDSDEADELLTDKYKTAARYTDVTRPYYDAISKKTSDEITKMMYIDMNLWLPNDIFLKADKMTMAHSLEIRAPFTDMEVWNTARKIPFKYKIKGKTTKYIFRQIAEEHIPEQWAKRKKLGFPVPFTAWLYEDKYYGIVKDTFTSSYASEFFITEKIIKLLDDHHNKIANNGRKIYTIYSFLIWYKQYF